LGNPAEELGNGADESSRRFYFKASSFARPQPHFSSATVARLAKAGEKQLGELVCHERVW
jgi:hypothetical protein